jgi:hypothetical protein
MIVNKSLDSASLNGRAPGSRLNFSHIQNNNTTQLSTFNKRKASDENRQKNATHNRYASHGNNNSMTPFLDNPMFDLNAV